MNESCAGVRCKKRIDFGEKFALSITAHTLLRVKASSSVGSMPSSELPERLVAQLTGKLAPAHICNGLGEATTSHSIDTQVLDAHRLVFTDDLRRELVKEILSGMTHGRMSAGYLDASLGAMLRSFLLTGQGALQLHLFLLPTTKVARVLNLPAIGERRTMREAQIYTYFASIAEPGRLLESTAR